MYNVQEIFIWREKNEWKTDELRSSITLLIVPYSSVPNQNAGFALVH